MVTLSQIVKSLPKAITDAYEWTQNLVGLYVRIEGQSHYVTNGWVREAFGPYLLIEPYEESYGTPSRVLVELRGQAIYFGEQPKRSVTNSPNSDVVQPRTRNLPVEPPVRMEFFGGKRFDANDPVHEGRSL